MTLPPQYDLRIMGLIVAVICILFKYSPRWFSGLLLAINIVAFAMHRYGICLAVTLLFEGAASVAWAGLRANAMVDSRRYARPKNYDRERLVRQTYIQCYVLGIVYVVFGIKCALTPFISIEAFFGRDLWAEYSKKYEQIVTRAYERHLQLERPWLNIKTSIEDVPEYLEGSSVLVDEAASQFRNLKPPEQCKRLNDVTVADYEALSYLEKLRRDCIISGSAFDLTQYNAASKEYELTEAQLRTALFGASTHTLYFRNAYVSFSRYRQ